MSGIFDLFGCCCGRDSSSTQSVAPIKTGTNAKGTTAEETPEDEQVTATKVASAPADDKHSAPQDRWWAFQIVALVIVATLAGLAGSTLSAGCVTATTLLGTFAFLQKSLRRHAEDLTRAPAKVMLGQKPDSKREDGVAILLEQFQPIAATRPELRLDSGACRRFLHARKGDVELAACALQKYVEWHAEARPHEITAADVKAELATGKSIVHGVDRAGRPVVWVFAGRHDKSLRNLQETVSLVLYNLEKAVSAGESNAVDKVCIVFDLSGFGMRSMDYDVAKRLIYILANFYPERLGQVIFWKPPTLFSVFWRVVKPWIDPVTLQKVNFVGEQDLFALVDPSMLPQETARATSA